MMLLFLSLACNTPKESTGPGCVDTPTKLSADEVSPGGFSPASILAFSTGARTDTFVWADEHETPLAYEMTPTADASWIDSVADYPDTGSFEAIGIVCSSRMEIPASLSFSTEDGVFTENFTGVLVAPAEGIATFPVDLTTVPLHGSFNPRDWPKEPYDTLSILLSANFLSSGQGGTISGSAQEDHGCIDGACSVDNEEITVGHWGGAGD